MSQQIYITQSDMEKLRKIIEKAKYIEKKANHYLRDLETELAKATVKSYDHIPPNVITMNSKVTLIIEGAEEDVTLVYPEDADSRKNRISVLSPIGTAILGLSEGNIIEWNIPSGSTQIMVKKVLFQPEAEGIYDL